MYSKNYKSLITNFWDFFLIRECEICGQKLSIEEEILCNSCSNQLKSVSISQLKSEFSQKNFDKYFSSFFSLYDFNENKEVQDLIHKLKYNNKFRIGFFFGKKIAENFASEFKDAKIDYLIPVPLHKIKKAERGYNQSFWICNGISRESKIKTNSRIVKRNKYTESQTTFNLTQRKENIKDAFIIKNKEIVKGKIFGIVDDVVTTGSTTTEIAKLLLNSGAKEIYLISIAIPILSKETD